MITVQSDAGSGVNTIPCSGDGFAPVQLEAAGAQGVYRLIQD